MSLIPLAAPMKKPEVCVFEIEVASEPSASEELGFRLLPPKPLTLSNI